VIVEKSFLKNINTSHNLIIELKMNDNNEKNARKENLDMESPQEEESGDLDTAEISRKTFLGDFPTEYHAFLEIIGSGEARKQFELAEEDVVIGRILDCEIQLSIDNISRRHALISFRNEEYQIEDLGSTNGTYVNGIKVEKCVLRNHDQIEIGGVKIIFNDEKV